MQQRGGRKKALVGHLKRFMHWGWNTSKQKIKFVLIFQVFILHDDKQANIWLSEFADQIFDLNSY